MYAPPGVEDPAVGVAHPVGRVVRRCCATERVHRDRGRGRCPAAQERMPGIADVGGLGALGQQPEVGELARVHVLPTGTGPDDPRLVALIELDPTCSGVGPHRQPDLGVLDRRAPGRAAVRSQVAPHPAVRGEREPETEHPSERLGERVRERAVLDQVAVSSVTEVERGRDGRTDSDLRPVLVPRTGAGPSARRVVGDRERVPVAGEPVTEAVTRREALPATPEQDRCRPEGAGAEDDHVGVQREGCAPPAAS